MSDKISIFELFDLSKKLGKDEIILDVRTADEYKEGHIPGSINISHELVAGKADQLKKYKKIYIHCRAGGRAQVAWDALKREGVTQLVCISSGGMDDWARAGFPVQK